jgi:preprotein translocase subunit SecE
MKLFNFFSEAFTELKENMTWPTWAETQKQTIIVALFSIIMALVTWGVDETFTRAVAGFFSLIK